VSTEEPPFVIVWSFDDEEHSTVLRESKMRALAIIGLLINMNIQNNRKDYITSGRPNDENFNWLFAIYSS
jgi:hypothetical protein